MSCAHSVARSCAQPAARAVNARWGGSSWPSGLLRLYRSTSGQKSLLGPISWDGVPTITADGVTPGDGPSFDRVTKGWQPWLTPRQTRMIYAALTGQAIRPEDEEHMPKLREWFGEAARVRGELTGA